MLELAAQRGAVLEVERHVEQGAVGHFGLQRQRLAHAWLDTGVVVAHRQAVAALVRAEQGLQRMDRHAVHRHRHPAVHAIKAGA